MSATTMRTGPNAAQRNPWRLAAAAMLPLAVLGLLLASLWNPMERLDTVKAAIVNLDEPVEVDGQTVPLGRQLASGLVSGGESADPAASDAAAAPASDASFAWEITSADRAADGLADGTYAAVVTIPEGFSAAATSFGGDDAGQARQATIDVATPPGGRVVDDALARIVATTASSVLGNALTETYVDNVLIGFGTLADGLGDAADGATQLADGAGEAGDGASRLADGASQLADGARQASGGATQLASGAGQLASGAREAAGGAAELANGASGLASGARGITQGIGGSAAGAEDLAESGHRLADGAQQVADGLAPIAEGAQALDDTLSSVDGTALESGLQELQGEVEAAMAQLGSDLGCATGPTTVSCTRLAELAEAMQDATGQISGAAEQFGTLRQQVGSVADGLSKLSTGAQQVAVGVSGIADGNADLGAGLRKLEAGSGKVADGADMLASGGAALSNGVGRLADGASGVSSGASGLADGVGQLGSGAGDLAAGAGELSGGVGQLADGAGDLADGIDEAVGQLPRYTEGERQNLAAVVADPVTGPSVDDLSTGATGPLFAVVALWLGALGLLTVVPPVAVHALGSTRGAVRLVLSGFRISALVGLTTGAAVGVILAAVENLSVGGWFAAAGVGALASVCFVALHQGFLGLLGNVGRGISLLIAVLLIGTGVVATVPAPLLALAEFLPTGAARDALAAVVVPGVQGVAGAVAGLVIWSLVGLAIAVGVTARRRVVRVGRLVRA